MRHHEPGGGNYYQARGRAPAGNAPIKKRSSFTRVVALVALLVALLALALRLTDYSVGDLLPQASSSLGGSSAAPGPQSTSATLPAAGSDATPSPDTIIAAPALLDEALLKPFAGKTWLVLGDSISEANPRTEKNYHTFIAEWLGLEVVTVAASGIGYRAGWAEEPPLPARVEGLPAEVDFITVFAGANDGGYALGTFDDGNPDTFYGALHSLYTQLIEKYPNTPIGVLSPLPAEVPAEEPKAWGEDAPFAAFANAVLEVAGHYSLPALDLYRESGLRPWNAQNNLTYFSSPEAPQGDGRHPNLAGHQLLASKILPFIVFNLQPSA